MAERQIFFVSGAPKSGTTWLQRILNAHPEVKCSGEGHFIERLTIPLAAVLREYAVHMSVVAEQVYEGAPCYPPIEQSDLDAMARTFILNRLTGGDPGRHVRWFGDKTPRYARHLPQLLRLFPRARFINIVRDPRDVAVARMHQARRIGCGSRVEDPAARLEFFTDGAIDWVNCVAPVGAFAAAHPGRLHALRYEDLIADPAGEMRALFRFLSVRHEAPLIDRIVRATSFEAQSGRKRGVEDPSAFLRKGVVGDWVGRIEPPALARIEQKCGSLMRDYGYGEDYRIAAN